MIPAECSQNLKALIAKEVEGHRTEQLIPICQIQETYIRSTGQTFMDPIRSQNSASDNVKSMLDMDFHGDIPITQAVEAIADTRGAQTTQPRLAAVSVSDTIITPPPEPTSEQINTVASPKLGSSQPQTIYHAQTRLICPWWLSFKGHSACSHPTSHPPYYHGLVQDAPHDRLECPFWKTYGNCNKGAKCAFEHRPTVHGLVCPFPHELKTKKPWGDKQR